MNILENREALFISSNVGAIFQSEELSSSWRIVLKKYISEKKAQIVVLTLQEFGGKSIISWEEANKFLGDIYQLFASMYSIFVSCVDCDTASEEFYTALCTIFLADYSIGKFELFDFEKNCFINFGSGYHVHKLSNSNELSVKIKFPFELFPHNKWSRKGYMINRFKLNATDSLDIVNLHLIHDSNFHLTLCHPSLFQEFRRKQLEHVLKTLDMLNSKSTVLCGDFNFRTSILDLIENYDKNYIREQDGIETDHDTILFKDATLKTTLLIVNSKEVKLSKGLLPVDVDSLKIHKKCDKELDYFKYHLMELPIDFFPTYCYSVNSDSNTYADSRCPSWCDRILFRGKISELIKNGEMITYESFGLQSVIGDHKPISISIPLYLLTQNNS